MSEDPIVQEVRWIRQEHAARFDHDLKAIFADLKRTEEARDQQQSPLLSPPEPGELAPNSALHRTANALRRAARR
jgi:hypothetical protein